MWRRLDRHTSTSYNYFAVVIRWQKNNFNSIFIIIIMLFFSIFFAKLWKKKIESCVSIVVSAISILRRRNSNSCIYKIVQCVPWNEEKHIYMNAINNNNNIFTSNKSDKLFNSLS